jgi:putative ABC transport system substrate-binding protein
MRRRDLISLIGGAAAWPLAARAQQAGKLPTIGFLGTDPSLWAPWTAAFVQRLREFGWIEGRTIAIEYRWAQGHSERYAEIAAEFVPLKVDMIVATGTAVPALKQATAVIPIVFSLSLDPLGGGLVASLARPGGNVTGFLRVIRKEEAPGVLSVPGAEAGLSDVSKGRCPPQCLQCTSWQSFRGANGWR